MTIPYPHTKHLFVAAGLSLAGQATALAFMLNPGPYTTIFFMGFGVVLIFAAIAVFGLVAWRDAKAKAESIKEKTFTAGEAVFRQGDVGDRVYIVKEGEVEVVREPEEPGKPETIIARLGEGEYFGEMALLSKAPRNATCRAATKLVTLSIDREDFNSLFSSVPAFKESVDKVLRQRGGTAAN